MKNWDERQHPRDEQGRFTDDWASRVSAAAAHSISGSSADWTESSPRQAYAEFIEQIRDILRHKNAIPEAMINDQMADLIGRVVPTPLAVYKQGPHRIYVATTKKVPVYLVQRYLAELQAVAPSREPIHLRIQPAQYMVLPGAEAETLRGTGVIALSEEVFDESTWAQHRVEHSRHFMPVAHSASKLQYYLAHEWGHVTDYDDLPGGDARAQQLLANRVDHAMSIYGSKHRHESRAEAFAEWYLSGGHSQNEAAVAYADLHGWEMS